MRISIAEIIDELSAHAADGAEYRDTFYIFKEGCTGYANMDAQDLVDEYCNLGLANPDYDHDPEAGWRIDVLEGDGKSNKILFVIENSKDDSKWATWRFPETGI